MQNFNEKFESAMIRLVKKHPFYANLLMNMQRRFDTGVPTIGVNVTDTVNLWVNPYFFDSLTTDQAVDILIHECGHVVNNHFSRFKELEPAVYEGLEKEKLKDMTPGDIVVHQIKHGGKHQALNMAGDFAINEYLPNLPKKFSLFDKEGNKFKDKEGKVIEVEPCLVAARPGWERYKNLEYYYDKLKEESKCGGNNQGQQGGKGKKKGQGSGQGQQQGQGQGQQPGDGQGDPNGQGQGGGGRNQHTIDDHGLWADGNQDQEYVLEKVKNAVNKAVEASGGLEAGNIPAEMKSAIHRLNYKPRDWRSDLQRFVARTSEMLIESSRKIRNRRYGVLYPGYKSFPKLTLAACVDTSGSMSDEALDQIACELERISQNNVEIWVIEADCVVQNVWKFDAKKLKEFKGRGGTAYQPALDKCAELDVDGCIYFGDMDSADRPKKPKFPVLWAVVNSNQKPPASFGAVTQVKIQKKGQQAA